MSSAFYCFLSCIYEVSNKKMYTYQIQPADLSYNATLSQLQTINICRISVGALHLILVNSRFIDRHSHKLSKSWNFILCKNCWRPVKLFACFIVNSVELSKKVWLKVLSHPDYYSVVYWEINDVIMLLSRQNQNLKLHYYLNLELS